MSKKKRPSSRTIRWSKLDNTANLFPVIAGESMTNVYRISVTLKEEIDEKLLYEALSIVLPKFEVFNVRMRTGLFWHYFEENGKPAPRVYEENSFPCRYIRPNHNRSYLFRVTYYKCRINLEVFHVLTDGMGGLNFLRELTYQYLRLAHPDELGELSDELSGGTSLDSEDSFLRHYKGSKANGFAAQKACLLKMEKLPSGEMGIIHGNLSVKALKEVSKGYGLSINEYLISVFCYSIYTEYLHRAPSDKPIRVAVPVNLRPYFDSFTTKNFFVMVSAQFKPEDRDYTFEDVAEIIKGSLREQINKAHLEDLFSYSVSNQVNNFMRPVPLALKNLAMWIVYRRSALANTSTVTNIGNIHMDEPYDTYVDKFHAFITKSKGQPLKGTICSYKDNLVFTFTSGLSDNRIQKAFFRKLSADGLEVTLETNQYEKM